MFRPWKFKFEAVGENVVCRVNYMSTHYWLE